MRRISSSSIVQGASVSAKRCRSASTIGSGSHAEISSIATTCSLGRKLLARFRRTGKVYWMAWPTQSLALTLSFTTLGPGILPDLVHRDRSSHSPWEADKISRPDGGCRDPEALALVHTCPMTCMIRHPIGDFCHWVGAKVDECGAPMNWTSVSKRNICSVLSSNDIALCYPAI
jgi:hypothetical protein